MNLVGIILTALFFVFFINRIIDPQEQANRWIKNKEKLQWIASIAEFRHGQTPRTSERTGAQEGKVGASEEWQEARVQK